IALVSFSIHDMPFQFLLPAPILLLLPFHVLHSQSLIFDKNEPISLMQIIILRTGTTPTILSTMAAESVHLFFSLSSHSYLHWVFLYENCSYPVALCNK